MQTRFWFVSTIYLISKGWKWNVWECSFPNHFLYINIQKDRSKLKFNCKLHCFSNYYIPSINFSWYFLIFLSPNLTYEIFEKNIFSCIFNNCSYHLLYKYFRNTWTNKQIDMIRMFWYLYFNFNSRKNQVKIATNETAPSFLSFL